ncbi:hypothetical protein Hanom_Chr12g01120011 [Helianthus anomalus]
MAFNSNKLLSYRLDYQLEGLPQETKNLAKFLEWFLPASDWDYLMRDSPRMHCMVLLHKPNILEKMDLICILQDHPPSYTLGMIKTPQDSTTKSTTKMPGWKLVLISRRKTR